MADTSTVELLARLLVSLTIIVGGLLAVRRWAGRARPGAATRTGIRVITRSALSRGASLAVVQVGERRFLVGAAESSIALLAELDDTVDGADTPLDPNLHHPDGPQNWPRTGLLDRLRAMTVRTHTRGPIRDHRHPL